MSPEDECELHWFDMVVDSQENRMRENPIIEVHITCLIKNYSVLEPVFDYTLMLPNGQIIVISTLLSTWWFIECFYSHYVLWFLY